MEAYSEHYQYEDIIFFNIIDEVISNNHMLTITFANQMNFKNVNDVRNYIKMRTVSSDPFDIVTVMMESFFAHFSTCLLDHAELIKMWVTLFNNSIEKLYHQNILLVPIDKRASVTTFEPYIENAHSLAEESGDPRRHSFISDKFRTKKELLTLFSKFIFMTAGRFYYPPNHLNKEHIKKYIKLKTNLILAWYDLCHIEDIIPESMITYTPPTVVAFKLFSPDTVCTLEELNQTKKLFDNWIAREKTITNMFTDSIQNKKLLQNNEREWRMAEIYGEQLYKALIPRATAQSKQLEPTVYDNDDKEMYVSDSESSHGEDVYGGDSDSDDDNDMRKKRNEMLFNQYKKDSNMLNYVPSQEPLVLPRLRSSARVDNGDKYLNRYNADMKRETITEKRIPPSSRIQTKNCHAK